MKGYFIARSGQVNDTIAIYDDRIVSNKSNTFFCRNSIMNKIGTAQPLQVFRFVNRVTCCAPYLQLFMKNINQGI